MGCSCRQCTEQGCLCDAYAQFFDALGNATRIHIVNALRGGKKSVTQICQLTEIEQSMASHSLRQLSEAGIVTRERNGRYIVYALNATIKPLMLMIDRHVEES